MAKTRVPYKLKDGTEVPSVTTVINRFKDGGGLYFWYWQQGIAGKPFKEELNASAFIGTMVHALVEAHVKGWDTPLFDAPPEMQERARQAYENYLAFEGQSGLEVISLESPLVSEKYGFGGTPDGLFRQDGELSLVDWKTAKGTYVDFLLQLAAYKVLWDENNPDNQITGGLHLCRFSKDHGDFAHYYYDELEEAWRMFQLLLEAYRIDKKLQARVK